MDVFMANTDGSYAVAASTPVRLRPGEWIPIIWTAPSTVHFWKPGVSHIPSTEAGNFSMTQSQVSGLDVLFWPEDQPFSGTVFIDDVRFYSSSSNGPA
jgi:hypothetical protein